MSTETPSAGARPLHGSPGAQGSYAGHGGHEDPNQFALLRQRRFAPFFWTQFSGAANDNLFKFAFTVMVTYQLSVGWLPPATLPSRMATKVPISTMPLPPVSSRSVSTWGR